MLNQNYFLILLLMLSSAVQTYSQNTIGDYVWCDDNGDGIQDPTEAPIAGVVIELLDNLGNVIGTMTTNANGAYDFTNLSAGTYTVNVVDTTVPDGKQLTTGNDPLLINLGPGEDFNDADFGYQYTGSIGDYVWCDDNGDGIQDPTEAPIAGVQIELIQNGMVIATMTTDANGFYDFTNLPPGMYTMNPLESTVPDGKQLTTGNDPLMVNLGPGEDFNDADFGYQLTDCPDAPSQLQVQNIASTSALLQWTGNGGIYQVVGNALGSPSIGLVSFGESLQVNNLLPNTGYYWTVLSLCGDSTISSMETDTFFTEAFCQPATNVQTINIGSDSAVLSWTPSPNALGYRLAAAEVPVDFNAIFYTTINAPASSYALKNLTPNTDYKWRIIAQCGYEASPLSPIVDFSTIDVSDPNCNITLTTTVFPAPCFGGTGFAAVSAKGGDGPYSYNWDDPNAQATALATGLAAGNYTVTVTDSLGCEAAAVVTITQPSEIILTVSGADALCADSCNGSASASASGGTGTISFVWNDPEAQGGHTATGLCAGVYTVSATDANGCTASITVTVNEPLPFSTMIFSQAATCDTICDGVLVASTLGGSGTSNTFQWDDVNSQTTAIATGLCPGTYSVTATDANGCTASATNIVGSLCKSGLTETPTNELLEFNLYPNPANDQVTISCEKVPNGWILFNVNGRAVGQNNTLDPLNSKWQIGLREYAPGIYFLQLSYEAHSQMHKLIIQR